MIHPNEDGTAHVLLPNTKGFIQRLEEGTLLGEVMEVQVLLGMSPVAVNVVLRIHCPAMWKTINRSWKEF